MKKLGWCSFSYFIFGYALIYSKVVISEKWVVLPNLKLKGNALHYYKIIVSTPKRKERRLKRAAYALLVILILEPKVLIALKRHFNLTEFFVCDLFEKNVWNEKKCFILLTNRNNYNASLYYQQLVEWCHW